MALPKKYFKLYPGNLKGAWAAYRKDLAARKSGKKVAARKTVRKKVGTKMATRKKTVRKATRAVATRVRYRTRQLKPVEMLIRALIGAFGGIGSSWAVNNSPFIKDLDPMVKSGVQLASGLGLLYFLPKKFEMFKYVGTGSFIAGVYGGAQKITGMPVLAGNSSLSNEEIQALLGSGYMNGPADMARLNGPAKMGAGERPFLMGDAGQQPTFMGGGFRY